MPIHGRRQQKPSIRHRRRPHGAPAGAPHARRLTLEALEDRRMLATFSVSNRDDSGPGSLRQAVIDANNHAGPDTVDATLLGGTIRLSSEIEILETLTIEGIGAERLTVDAQQNSRIFSFNSAIGDLTIRGLTLTGGKTGGTRRQCHR